MQRAVHLSRLTPLSFLERTAFAFPERVGVFDGERRLTWREFAERVRRLAVALQATGIQKDDRVAFLAPNTSELLEAHYGVPAAGAVLVAINTRLKADEIGYIVGHSGARLVVVDPSLTHLVAGLNVERLLVTGEGGAYEAFLASAADGGPEDRLESEDDTISINYTSGTTGRPKGVMYTHRGAYLNALAEAAHAQLSSRSVYLWTLPMFHCNGWCFTWAVTAAGGTHVCLRKVDPAVIFPTLRDEGVTVMCGAPVVLTMLIHAPESVRCRFPQAVDMATGGAAPPSAVIAAMERMGFRVKHLYGLTETYGPSAVCVPQPEWEGLPQAERAAVMARQGVRLPTMRSLRVGVGETFEPVPADGKTLGELMLRGNTVMKGYLKNPSATEEAFRGEWFHTGDLAVRHPDGYIEVKDRSKDIIISGGENVSSLEVEEVLYQHPLVMEAAVVAMPHPHWGERPCAFVTVKPDTEAPPEAEILEWCRRHLARFKVPDRVVYGPLPKTSTGKIQKFILRDREWAGREKRIN
jgi:fatty-acyl-CoA synthase